MLALLQALESRLLEIEEDGQQIIDKVRPLSRIDDLEPDEDGPGFEDYAVTHEIVGDDNYKNRKGKYETTLFLNLYSNVNGGDVAVLWLASKIKEALDEADLSDASLGLKTYMVKTGSTGTGQFQGSSPQPEFNERVQAWQTVVRLNVRWENV